MNDEREIARTLSRSEMETVFSTVNAAHMFMPGELDLHLPDRQFCSIEWLV